MSALVNPLVQWTRWVRISLSFGRYWHLSADHHGSPMKILILSLITLLAAQTLAIAGVDTEISQTNRVILTVGKWTPSEKESQKALTAVQAYLEKPTASTNTWVPGEIKKILAHAKDYRVQFSGVLLDGKKWIRCNFFPAQETAEDPFGYRKQQEVNVLDGGFWFWHIYYDPSTGKCTKFMPNGYA
jgi:hypothetical protein